VDNLLRDGYARERYGILTGALGGEPEGGNAKAALARLCAWTAKDDIEIFAGLIRLHVSELAYRYRPVVAETAEIVRASGDRNDTGDVIIAVPADLARRLILAAEDKQ
jgi:hypothetical protein